MSEKRAKYSWISGHRILVLGILCLFGFCLLAQRPVQKKAAVTPAGQKKDTVVPAQPAKKEEPKQKSKVYLLHSDMLKKTLDRSDVQVVVGNVVFRHDSLYMYCDSAYYFDQLNSFEAFGNVRMEHTVTIFFMTV